MNNLYDVLRNRHEAIMDLAQKDSQTETSPKAFEPRVLWLGCSDSKLPSSLISGLESGQVLLHCNLANQIYKSDLTLQAVLEYALHQLSVSHIVVCGHYECKGIMAALKIEDENNPNMNDWLSGIYRLAAQHGDEIRSLPNQKARVNRLAELNVLHQVQLLQKHPLLDKYKITLLPWIYDSKTGQLQDLRGGKLYSHILRP